MKGHPPFGAWPKAYIPTGIMLMFMVSASSSFTCSGMGKYVYSIKSVSGDSADEARSLANGYSGYTMHPVELNEDVGGQYQHLLYKKHTFTDPASIGTRGYSKISVRVSGSSMPGCWSGWTALPHDMNEGAGGDYIRICLKRRTSCKDPIVTNFTFKCWSGVDTCSGYTSTPSGYTNAGNVQSGLDETIYLYYQVKSWQSYCTKCLNGATVNSGCGCDCRNSWHGTQCEQCTLQCTNEGSFSAVDCKCTCPYKWEGADCGTCPNPLCSNNGIRFPGSNSIGNQHCYCACPMSWSGYTCTTPLNKQWGDYEFKAGAVLNDKSVYSRDGTMYRNPQELAGLGSGEKSLLFDLVNPEQRNPIIQTLDFEPGNATYFTADRAMFGGEFSLLSNVRLLNFTSRFPIPLHRTLAYFADSDGTYAVHLEYTEGNGVNFTVVDGIGTVTTVVSPGGVFIPGIWHHLAITVSVTGEIKIFKDGQVTHSETNAGIAIPYRYQRNMYFGRQHVPSQDRDYYLGGEISTLKIYAEVRQSAQIAAEALNIPVPGDGTLGPSEECDDGNSNSGDGCSYPGMQIEAPWVCKGQPSVCLRFEAATPRSAAISGGEILSLSGGGFGESPGISVSLNGNPCDSVTHVSSSEVLCKAPSSIQIGLVDIAFSRSMQTYTFSNTFEYVSGPPSVSSISPRFGQIFGGTAATISGNNFGESSLSVDDIRVHVGGIPCTTIVWVNKNNIVCTVPLQNFPGNYTVYIENKAGGLNVTNGFEYIVSSARLNSTASISIGSSEYDKPLGIVADSSSIFLVGETLGDFDGDGRFVHKGKLDGIVIRTDRDANIMWTSQFGTAEDDSFAGVSIIEDGIVFAGGYTKGTYASRIQATNKGGKDALIVGISVHTGIEIMPAIQIGSPGDDEVTVLAAFGGLLYAGGQMGGSMLVSEYLFASPIGAPDNQDIFMMEFNTAGDILRLLAHGTALSHDIVKTMSVTADGIYIAGSTNTTYDPSRILEVPFCHWAGDEDNFLLKTGSLLARNWVSQVGQEGPDWHVFVAADGNALYDVGVVYPTADNSDVYMMKHDPAGLLRMFSSFGEASVNETVVAGTERDRVVYAVGSVDGDSDGPGDNIHIGLHDVFVVSFDKTSGRMFWVYQFGTAQDDFGVGVTVSAAGDQLIVIHTRGSGSSADAAVTRIPLAPPGTRALSWNVSEPCLPGEYSSSYNQVSCDVCDPGYFASGYGNSKPTLCPAGTYQNSLGSSSCIDVPLGHYTGIAGSVEPVKCEPGTFSSVRGAVSCEKCPRGTYNPDYGSKSLDACLPCPLGKHGPSQGLTVCLDCAKGYHSDRTGAATCKQCLGGTYGDREGLATCLACPPGTRNPLAAKVSVSSCIPCPSGTEPSGTSTSCNDCSPGFYQPMEGGARCIPCPRGHANSATGQTACTPCKRGEFQDQTGQTSCSLCPANTYQDVEGSPTCNPCPNESSSDVGAPDASLCKCQSGEHGRPLEGFPCFSCDTSKVSCNGNDLFPAPYIGFWTPSLNVNSSLTASGVQEARIMASSSSSYTSPPVYTCMPRAACPGSSSEECSSGYSGTACRNCASGYVRELGSCVKCNVGEGSDDPAVVAVSFALLLLGITIAVFALILTITMTQDLMELWSDFITVTSTTSGTLHHLSVHFSTVIHWVQLVHAVLSIQVAWPPAFLAIGVYITGIAQFNIFDALQLGCFLSSTAYTAKYYIRMAIFAYVIVLFGFIAVVAKMAKVSSGWFKCIFPLRRLNRAFELMSNQSIRSGLFLVSTYYTYILTLILEPFVCYEQVEGEFYLVAEPSVKCFSSENGWTDVLPGAAIAILLGGLGVPVIFAYILMFKLKSPSKTDLQRYEWVWQDFQPKYSYWLLFNMGLSFWFVFGLTMSFLSTRDQISWLLFASMFSLFFTCWVRPYEAWQDNVQVVLSDLGLFSLLLSSLALDSDNTSNLAKDLLVALVSIVALGFVAYSVYIILTDILTPFMSTQWMCCKYICCLGWRKRKSVDPESSKEPTRKPLNVTTMCDEIVDEIITRSVYYSEGVRDNIRVDEPAIFDKECGFRPELPLKPPKLPYHEFTLDEYSPLMPAAKANIMPPPIKLQPSGFIPDRKYVVNDDAETISSGESSGDNEAVVANSPLIRPPGQRGRAPSPQRSPKLYGLKATGPWTEDDIEREERLNAAEAFRRVRRLIVMPLGTSPKFAVPGDPKPSKSGWPPHDH